MISLLSRLILAHRDIFALNRTDHSPTLTVKHVRSRFALASFHIVNLVITHLPLLYLIVRGIVLTVMNERLKIENSFFMRI